MPRRLSNFQMAISRFAISAFLLIVLCHVAKADPVVPVGTVLGEPSQRRVTLCKQLLEAWRL